VGALIESTPVLPVRLKIATATQSIARLITPAVPRPIAQSRRMKRSSSRRSSSSRASMRRCVSAECR